MINKNDHFKKYFSKILLFIQKYFRVGKQINKTNPGAMKLREEKSKRDNNNKEPLT
jgi:hypothetical protein